SAGRRRVERLADLPRPFHVARGDLQVAPRKIDADAIAPDTVERLLEPDVAAARLERHHQLHFVMYILGERWIRHGCPVRHHRVGGLGEEKRWIAHVMTHLFDVLLVIAPDAPDAAHRKRLVATGDRDGGLRRRRNDIAVGSFGLGGHGLSFVWSEFKLWMRQRPAGSFSGRAAAGGRKTRKLPPFAAARPGGPDRGPHHPPFPRV